MKNNMFFRFFRVVATTGIALTALTNDGLSQVRDIRLDELQQDAIRVDPRTRQLSLYQQQSQLKIRNIQAEWLPVFALEGKAQYQSIVATIPLTSPAGGPLIKAPPHDSYDAFIGIQQRLIDFTGGARKAAEEALLSESQAGVHTALYSLRQEVNESFFAASLLQERLKEIALVIEDLEARLKETEARVREGAALPSSSAMIRVAILQRRQDEAELRSSRKAALEVLNELTGREITEEDNLSLPVVGNTVSTLKQTIGQDRSRPEYRRFSLMRDRIVKQSRVLATQEMPRVFAFGRAGYGRPGLNFFSTKFEAYWLAGLQVQWSPWNWGSVKRDRQALVIQQNILDAEEEAFTEALRRATQNDFASIERLDSTIKIDDEIIALREQIEREARVQFDEGVMTTSDYLNRVTELSQARVSRLARQVERAHAHARLLNTLGLDVK